METLLGRDNTFDRRIADRLKTLRSERGWSLDELAKLSGVSRATLSRLENAEVSPTASVLGKLSAAFGLTISRLMFLIEENFTPLVRAEVQPVWQDAETGFERRSVSPPTQMLAGEVLACTLKPGARIAYDRAPRPGLEHHLLLITGQLHLDVDGQSYELNSGDCLRFRLFRSTIFSTPEHCSAYYHLFLV